MKIKEEEKVKYLRIDNEGEYRNDKFLQFYKDECITSHFTIPKTHQQNGVVETMNKTLLEKEMSMRLHTRLPKSFWEEVVNHACYVVNRSPSKALNSKVAEKV